ncbi:MAG: hypothetical protein EOO18_11160 [Chryseobacterium sp.]|nr:MAG: hypothetical protein EOO18_11160 [Chryseobacterium sp.]
MFEDEYFEKKPNEVESEFRLRLWGDNHDELEKFKKQIEPAKVEKVQPIEMLESRVRSLLKKLTEILVSVVSESSLGQEPLPETEKPLRVASPGLYVDSLMGLRPATEPYAEEMRAQTVLLKSAEAEKERALAQYYRHLAGSQSYSSGSNIRIRLVGVWEKPVLSLRCNTSLRAGTWSLQVDGKDILVFEWQDGSTMAQVQISNDANWINELDKHAYSIKSLTGSDTLQFIISSVDLERIESTMNSPEGNVSTRKKILLNKSVIEKKLELPKTKKGSKLAEKIDGRDSKEVSK